MSPEWTKVFAAGSPAWGARVEEPDERPAAGVFPPDLVPADDHRLRVARHAYTEANPADFERSGKRLRDWTDKATGKKWRAVSFDATLNDDSRDGGVELFVIIDGRWLAFLRPLDFEERGRGAVGGQIIERRVG